MDTQRFRLWPPLPVHHHNGLWPFVYAGFEKSSETKPMDEATTVPELAMHMRQYLKQQLYRQGWVSWHLARPQKGDPNDPAYVMPTPQWPWSFEQLHLIYQTTDHKEPPQTSPITREQLIKFVQTTPSALVRLIQTFSYAPALQQRDQPQPRAQFAYLSWLYQAAPQGTRRGWFRHWLTLLYQWTDQRIQHCERKRLTPVECQELAMNSGFFLFPFSLNVLVYVSHLFELPSRPNVLPSEWKKLFQLRRQLCLELWKVLSTPSAEGAQLGQYLAQCAPLPLSGVHVPHYGDWHPWLRACCRHNGLVAARESSQGSNRASLQGSDRAHATRVAYCSHEQPQWLKIWAADLAVRSVKHADLCVSAYKDENKYPTLLKTTQAFLKETKNRARFWDTYTLHETSNGLLALSADNLRRMSPSQHVRPWADERCLSKSHFMSQLYHMVLHGDDFKTYVLKLAPLLRKAFFLMSTFDPDFPVEVVEDALVQRAPSPLQELARRVEWHHRRSSLMSTHMYPLAADFQNYQFWVHMNWRHLEDLLQATPDRPEVSRCGTEGQGYVTLQPEQEFMAEHYSPGCPHHVQLLHHSVGSGKTCTAVLTAFYWAQAGYRIVWVTKDTLKATPLKNLVRQICYPRLAFQALSTALTFESRPEPTPPSEVSFTPEAVGQWLQTTLGHEWHFLTYRTFTNALTDTDKDPDGVTNELGRKWRERAGSSGDVLERTLVIVDEAHNLFDPHYELMKRAATAELWKRVQYSHSRSGTSAVRFLLLTATPMHHSPLTFSALLSLGSADPTLPLVIPPVLKAYEAPDLVKYMQQEERFQDQALRSIQQIAVRKAELSRVVGSEGGSSRSSASAGVGEDWLQKLQVGLGPAQLSSQGDFARFWRAQPAALSFFNNTADYTRFPRTLFHSKYVLTCSSMQEKQLVGALVTKAEWTDRHRRRMVRRISNWAVFHNNKTLGKALNQVAKLIGQPEEQIYLANNHILSPFKPSALSTYRRLSFLKTHMQSLQAQALKDQDLFERLEQLGPKRTSSQNQLWSDMVARRQSLDEQVKVLEQHAADLKARLQAFPPGELEREQQLEVTRQELFTRLRQQYKQNNVQYADADQESGNESGLEDEPQNEVDQRMEELQQQRVADELEAGLSNVPSGDWRPVRWEAVRGRERKVWPASKHGRPLFFDHPDFQPEAFRTLLPFYAPKAAALLQQIEKDTLHDVSRYGFTGKRVIFCDDLHSVRVVAGTLISAGWKWAQEPRLYQRGKTKQYRVQYEVVRPPLNPDQPRFLVLTKGKLGGAAGSALTPAELLKVASFKRQDLDTFNHPDNAQGHMYRAVIVDRNFMEGVDLPSTYGDFFDTFHGSDLVQAMGRISRHCGLPNSQFVSGEGWQQHVYRYELRFRQFGLPLGDSGISNLEQRQRARSYLRHRTRPDAHVVKMYNLLKQAPDAEGHRAEDDSGYIRRLSDHVFGPEEVEMLLSGPLEKQFKRKSTIQLMEALSQQLSVGRYLYKRVLENFNRFQASMAQTLAEEYNYQHDLEGEYLQQQLIDKTTGQFLQKYHTRSYALFEQNQQQRMDMLVNQYADPLKQAVQAYLAEHISRFKSEYAQKGAQVLDELQAEVVRHVQALQGLAVQQHLVDTQPGSAFQVWLRHRLEQAVQLSDDLLQQRTQLLAVAEALCNKYGNYLVKRVRNEPKLMDDVARAVPTSELGGFNWNQILLFWPSHNPPNPYRDAIQKACVKKNHRACLEKVKALFQPAVLSRDQLAAKIQAHIPDFRLAVKNLTRRELAELPPRWPPPPRHPFLVQAIVQIYQEQVAPDVREGSSTPTWTRPRTLEEAQWLWPRLLQRVQTLLNRAPSYLSEEQATELRGRYESWEAANPNEFWQQLQKKSLLKALQNDHVVMVATKPKKPAQVAKATLQAQEEALKAELAVTLKSSGGRLDLTALVQALKANPKFPQGLSELQQERKARALLREVLEELQLPPAKFRKNRVVRVEAQDAFVAALAQEFQRGLQRPLEEVVAAAKAVLPASTDPRNVERAARKLVRMAHAAAQLSTPLKFTHLKKRNPATVKAKPQTLPAIRVARGYFDDEYQIHLDPSGIEDVFYPMIVGSVRGPGRAQTPIGNQKGPPSPALKPQKPVARVENKDTYPDSLVSTESPRVWEDEQPLILHVRAPNSHLSLYDSETSSIHKRAEGLAQPMNPVGSSQSFELRDTRDWVWNTSSAGEKVPQVEHRPNLHMRDRPRENPVLSGGRPLRVPHHLSSAAYRQLSPADQVLLQDVMNALLAWVKQHPYPRSGPTQEWIDKTKEYQRRLMSYIPNLPERLRTPEFQEKIFRMLTRKLKTPLPVQVGQLRPQRHQLTALERAFDDLVRNWPGPGRFANVQFEPHPKKPDTYRVKAKVVNMIVPIKRRMVFLVLLLHKLVTLTHTTPESAIALLENPRRQLWKSLRLSETETLTQVYHTFYSLHKLSSESRSK